MLRPRLRASMRRREILGVLGGVAAWPLSARAQQQAGKLPTVGFLGTGTPTTHSQWLTAFVQRMRELGWIEGRNLAIEHRWAEGRNERFAEIAAEFVRMKVDVIVTGGSAVPAAKQATSTIPIVFGVGTDPVGAGYVASLARPGGNVTGLSQQRTDTAGKRLELLREVFPGMRRLAVMGNVGNPSTMLEMDEVQTIGRTLGLDVAKIEVRKTEDIAAGFQALKGRVEALYVASEPLALTNRVRIITLAQDAKLPTIFGIRDYVEAGGLMSYGPNFPDMYRRAGDFADKILRGAMPADIPVEQPTKFDLVFNRDDRQCARYQIPSGAAVHCQRGDRVIARRCECRLMALSRPHRCGVACPLMRV